MRAMGVINAMVVHSRNGENKLFSPKANTNKLNNSNIQTTTDVCSPAYMWSNKARIGGYSNLLESYLP